MSGVVRLAAGTLVGGSRRFHFPSPLSSGELAFCCWPAQASTLRNPRVRLLGGLPEEMRPRTHVVRHFQSSLSAAVFPFSFSGFRMLPQKLLGSKLESSTHSFRRPGITLEDLGLGACLGHGFPPFHDNPSGGLYSTAACWSSPLWGSGHRGDARYGWVTGCLSLCEISRSVTLPTAPYGPSASHLCGPGSRLKAAQPVGEFDWPIPRQGRR